MRNTIKRINYYVQYVAGFTLIGLMCLTVADVILRRFFNDPIGGSYELTCVLLTFIVFFGVGYAQDFKEHVVIDFVYDLLPRKGRRIVSYISTILYLAVVILIIVVVFNYGIKLIDTHATTAILKIPHWPIVLIAVLGLIGYALSVIGDLLFLKEGGVLSHDND